MWMIQIVLIYMFIVFQFQVTMEPPIPLKGVVLFIAFGSMVISVLFFTFCAFKNFEILVQLPSVT